MNKKNKRKKQTTSEQTMSEQTTSEHNSYVHPTGEHPFFEPEIICDDYNDDNPDYDAYHNNYRNYTQQITYNLDIENEYE